MRKEEKKRENDGNLKRNLRCSKALAQIFYPQNLHTPSTTKHHPMKAKKVHNQIFEL